MAEEEDCRGAHIVPTNGSSALIDSTPAPLIPPNLLSKWQDTVDVMAELVGVAAGLIMRIAGASIEVLVASNTANNPYRVSDSEHLFDSGLYCESVIRHRRALLIPNALDDPNWENNPDLRLGMVSYLGFPILWPDGKPFGTICVLDRQPRTYPGIHQRLVEQCRDLIESQLAQITSHPELAIRMNFDRNYSEEALRLSEERYRLLVEHAADDFFLHDEHGHFLDISQQACLNTGYSREELLRMRVVDIGIDHDQPEVEAILARTSPDTATTVLSHHRRKDGSVFPVEVRISCQLIQGRKLFLGMVRDISERVEAERAIRQLNAELEQRVIERTMQWRQSSGLLRTVMNETPDLIFIKDCDGRYLLINEATEKVMGRPSDEVLGKVDSELFEPEIAQALIENDRRVLTDGEPYTIEETAYVDSVLRTYSSNKAPYRDEHGHIIGLIGISRDITAMKKAERALRRSELRWEFALDGSGDGIWDWNVQTGHVFYSRQWKAMLGYTENEIGSTVDEWSARVHPEDMPRCQEIIDDHFRGNTPDFVLEHRMLAKDGSWHWILDRGKIIERDTDGQPQRVIGTHTDITVRKEGESSILALNQRLQLAIQVSGVGIWELPNITDGRFVWDEQMHALYGLEPTAFRGDAEEWIARLHPDDREKTVDAWQAALSDTATCVFSSEFRIVLPTQELRHLCTQAQIFRDTDGSLLRVLGVNWDITTARLAAETLQQAKEAAEAAEHAKGEFLAVMSHEIRTPMNTVLGMTRLALQTELAPRQKNYLDKVNAAAQTLIAIINNVLDFSKIEAGRLEIEQTEFALESVLESVSAVTSMKAEEKGLEIAYAIAPNVPRRLMGDSLRLGQVLINLVNNAIKFTHQGEIVVAVTAVQQDDERRLTLQFKVRDTGIGLDSIQIAGLFQVFSQADSQTSRRYGGTGLGLAICKQLVQLMGGQIWVASEPAKGSTFYFTIEAQYPEQAIASHAPPRPLSLSGRRVLIADDNASARDILAQMVHGFGMQVETVDSGAATLIQLRQAARQQRPFELVLMDWRMPGIDGLEAAQQIRADPELQQTPAVLMVTAYGREEVLQRAEQLGLQGVLLKPVTESLMFDTLTHLIGGPPDRGPIAKAGWADEPGHRHAAENKAPADLAGHRVLVVDDNALNREVASEFLLAAGMLVATANDGFEALSYLRRHDVDIVLMDVHMPGMDGLTATREIRRHARWSSLPIVALTARARTEDRETSTAAGMNAHLTKPIDESTLYETLLHMLSPVPPAPDSSTPAPSSRSVASIGSTVEPPNHSSQLDLVAALAHLGGRRPLLFHLLRSFARDFGSAPARLAEDLRSGNTESIASLVHAIRGAATYLYAHALCEAAVPLEDAGWRNDLGAIRLHAPLFSYRLGTVLDELQELLAQASTSHVAPEPGERAAVRLLLAEAEPLIARGDPTALPLLSDIDTHLVGTTIANLAQAIRAHFGRLEFDSASVALQQLRATIDGMDTAGPCST